MILYTEKIVHMQNTTDFQNHFTETFIISTKKKNPTSGMGSCKCFTLIDFYQDTDLTENIYF